jgi:hypothetical protein
MSLLPYCNMCYCLPCFVIILNPIHFMTLLPRCLFRMFIVTRKWAIIYILSLISSVFLIGLLCTATPRWLQRFHWQPWFATFYPFYNLCQTHFIHHLIISFYLVSFCYTYVSATVIYIFNKLGIMGPVALILLFRSRFNLLSVGITISFQRISA